MAVDLAPPPGAATAPAATDDFDDAAAWTSRHYDGEDGDGDGDSAFDADLFDPDAGARSNAFDAAGAAEGAGDDGVFLRCVHVASASVEQIHPKSIESPGSERSSRSQRRDRFSATRSPTETGAAGEVSADLA